MKRIIIGASFVILLVFTMALTNAESKKSVIVLRGCDSQSDLQQTLTTYYNIGYRVNQASFANNGCYLIILDK